MSQLYECLVDYASATKGIKFIPFAPVVGTVCTLVNSDNGYLFEEVEVKDFMNRPWRFRPCCWRKLIGVPESDEIQDFVEECQLVEI